MRLLEEQTGVHPLGTCAEALVGSLAVDTEGLADICPRRTVVLAGCHHFDASEPVGCLCPEEGGTSPLERSAHITARSTHAEVRHG